MSQRQTSYRWWQTGIIYQIYPRSFQDSDGNGIGDLPGIIRRLDYLKWLGVTAVWLSPIYPSPMVDFGYDISDYKGIHPLFGTMDDFDKLLQEVHHRDMKLILDLVPNHTSDQHPWFKESRSSRDNPKRDWYLWRDPLPDGAPPNNWLSEFGGGAWEWDEATGQFYLHGFLKEQPNLNWRNPAVQQAIFDVMRFWLDKGVDGFRVDAIYHLIKDRQWRDNPPNPDYRPHQSDYHQLLPVFSTNQQDVHQVVHLMREVLDSYDERMMIGEVYLPIHKLVKYYGPNNSGIHLPFNFLLISLAWETDQLAAGIAEYEGALPSEAWPNWVLGNHDRPRISSRIGGQQARVAAIMLLTLRGTPTLYYGDEIGMSDVALPQDEVQDPQGKNMPGKNLSRDPARTPMQWDNSDQAGFTTGKPWLKIAPDASRVNVQSLQEDSASTLNLYHRLIQLRQQEPSLTIGDYTPVYSDRQLLAYIRQCDDYPRFLVVLNLSHQPGQFTINHYELKGTIEIATLPELEGQPITNTISLRGDEGIVVRLD